MLTLRCTEKMLKKLKVKAEPNPPASDTLLGDWCGNLLRIGRKEYFLFTNARTLISVLTRAAPALPLHEFLPYLHSLLVDYGVPADRAMAELQAMSPITLAKTDNRSVLGVMNLLRGVLKWNDKLHGPDFDITCPEIHHVLWEIPIGAMKYLFPSDAVRNVFEGRDLHEKRTDPVRLPRIPMPEGLMEMMLEGLSDEHWRENRRQPRPESAPALTLLRPDGSSRKYPIPRKQDPES